MRTNKRKSVDIAIANAWQRVFDEAVIDDLEALENQGWMTIRTFSEKTGIGAGGAAKTLGRIVASNRMDSKKIRCRHSGSIRVMTVYRPRV